ncbi:hypothetical protein F444_11047 [Phytophthora nicotianae P1976]|uniref:Uncharacterized protein n=2 Tax=Phytophthora nicotianae TaxID=4792 RepID=A0A081A255_PHYNI|nr:hypothetical protein F444_11047 [Phytophthora nicotianae P1976]
MASSSVPQLPLPSLLTCRITAKNGEPYTRAHEKVSPKEFVLTIAEGPAALRKIIEKKLEEMVPGQWQPGFAVFLKPSNHAKQKDYVPLVESSAFKAQLEGVWHAARRRKVVKPGLFLSSSYTSSKSRERQALRFVELPPRVFKRYSPCCRFLTEVWYCWCTCYTKLYGRCAG